MSEKFSLKWNDYNSNWNKSLSKLRENLSPDPVAFWIELFINSVPYAASNACNHTFVLKQIMEMRHQKYRARIVPDDHDQIQGRQERTTRVGQKHRAKIITAPENIFDAIDLAILRRQQSFSFQGKSYYFQYVGNTLREDLHAIA